MKRIRRVRAQFMHRLRPHGRQPVTILMAAFRVRLSHSPESAGSGLAGETESCSASVKF
jgi:hypothetical protein